MAKTTTAADNRHSPSLFFGFFVDQQIAKEIQQANPSLVTMLTQGGDIYLESQVIHEKQYFGKRLAPLTPLSALEALEKNIYSLVQRIVPSITPPLVILTLPS